MQDWNSVERYVVELREASGVKSPSGAPLAFQWDGGLVVARASEDELPMQAIGDVYAVEVPVGRQEQSTEQARLRLGSVQTQHGALADRVVLDRPSAWRPARSFYPWAASAFSPDGGAGGAQTPQVTINAQVEWLGIREDAIAKVSAAIKASDAALRAELTRLATDRSMYDYMQTVKRAPRLESVPGDASVPTALGRPDGADAHAADAAGPRAIRMRVGEVDDFVVTEAMLQCKCSRQGLVAEARKRVEQRFSRNHHAVNAFLHSMPDDEGGWPHGHGPSDGFMARIAP